MADNKDERQDEGEAVEVARAEEKRPEARSVAAEEEERREGGPGELAPRAERGNDRKCTDDYADLFNRLRRACENGEGIINECEKLYNNAKFYFLCGQQVGALVSYSCASVLLHNLMGFICEGLAPDLTAELENLLKCCLTAVKMLQGIVNMSSSSSSKNNSKDDEDTKNWDKICVKYKPLVFNEGSSDCIFFDDVAGLEKEKKIVEYSLIYPLIYPNLYPKASKGILIYGPPGTGKTYLVKAAVNKLQDMDPSVGVLFFAPSPGDLKGKFVGETEKRIEEIFTCASRAACRYQKDCKNGKKYISVIFMDEMDAIGPNRDTDTTGLAVNSVNTLLQMMDGVKSRENVSVIAATNYPWNLDGAILRRFDTQIFINLPEERDMKKLLSNEINRMINLDSDKSNYNLCDTMDDDKGEKDGESSLICDIKCKQNKQKDLYSQAPYNKLQIEFYQQSGKDGLVNGIISKLKQDNFSNSDISRLLKTAATNAGELSIRANLFYSLRLLDDQTRDKYISCLTKFKNDEDAIRQSVRILDQFRAANSPDANSLGTDIYQVSQPKYTFIKYGNNTYYNAKCILYKSEKLLTLLNHHLIDDIYVKYDPPDGADETAKIAAYRRDILGRPLGTMLNMFTIGPNWDGTTNPIEIVISFKHIFKKQVQNAASNPIMPISTRLINGVFKPLFNTFTEIKTAIDSRYKITKQQTPTEEARDRASLGNQGDSAPEPVEVPPAAFFNTIIQDINTTFGFHNITADDLTVIQSNTMFNPNPADGPFVLNDTVQKIISEESFLKTCDQNIRDPKLNFNNFKTHQFDLFNYLAIFNLLYSILNEEKKRGLIQQNWNTLTDSFFYTRYMSCIPTDGLLTVIIQEPLLAAGGGGNAEQLAAREAEEAAAIAVDDYDIKSFVKLSDNSTFNIKFQKTTRCYILSFLELFQFIKYNSIYKEVFGLNTLELSTDELNALPKVSIHENLFYIMFSNTFKIMEEIPKIDFGATDNSYFNDTSSKIIQVYFDDIFNFIDLCKYLSPLGNPPAQADVCYQCLSNYLTELKGITRINSLFDVVMYRLYDNYKFIQRSDYKCDAGGPRAAIVRAAPPPPGPPPGGPPGGALSGPTRRGPPARVLSPPSEKLLDQIKATLVTNSSIYDEIRNLNDIEDAGDKLLPLVGKTTLNVDEAFYLLAKYALDHDLPLDLNKADTSAQARYDFLHRYSRPEARSAGGSSSTRRHKRHNKNKNRNKTKSLHSKNTKYHNKANIKYNMSGGADEGEAASFKQFCINGFISDAETQSIIQKNIFIKTFFNFDAIEDPKRSNFLYSLGGLFYSGTHWMANSFNAETYKANAEEQQQNIIKKLTEKNLMLSLIFKEVSAIGFLVENAPPQNQPKTIADDKISPEEIKIQWTDINIAGIVPILSEIKSAVIGVVPTGDMGGIIQKSNFARILETVLSGLSVRYLVGGALDFTSTGGIINVAYLSLGILSNLYTLIYRDQSDKKEIINNLLLTQIFDTVLELGYTETTMSFNDFPYVIFDKQIQDNLIQTTNWLYKIYKVTKSFTLSKISTNPTLNDIQPYVHSNKSTTPDSIKTKLVNINIPMSSFYYALNNVKSTYDPETGKALALYYENKDKFLAERKKEKK
jgi:SpoVK/Ycf46/Vps4 family AAA+-type ATPase